MRLATLRFPLAVALLGGLLASTAVAAPFGMSDEERAARDAFRQRLADMLDAVETYHVDEELDASSVVQGAINGMLDTLDPHTNFLNADSYKGMRESQDGSFFGLGIIISVRKDRAGARRLTVISPIDGTPAKRLGLRAGDIISEINGESTEGLGLDGAVAKLRGQKGTKVDITIQRGSESIALKIERSEIPTESVQHAYMIEPGTGFIRVKDFTRTTKRELDDAVGRLLEEGMERLVLDLRDNPGGLLDTSVDVASTFLDRDDLVVETKGRVPNADETHRVGRGSGVLPSDVPLVVLVNRGSASASEIVSGAIQDHDRGLVVGKTSWGKGLVQSVYSLSSDSGLALTTARYYTPSGRQIQRDYRSSYFDYYFPKADTRPEGEVHLTDGGRRVLSGGGIEPDVEVDGFETKPLAGRMIQESIFFRFARHHREAGLPDFRKDRDLKKRELEAFREFVEEENLEFDEEQWQEALPQIAMQVRYELANLYLGWKEGFKVINNSDPQVKAALKLLPHARQEAILADARDGRVHEVVLAGADGERLPDVEVRTVVQATLSRDPEREPPRRVE
jgi:carboxyl-terminal processing protease